MMIRRRLRQAAPLRDTALGLDQQRVQCEALSSPLVSLKIVDVATGPDNAGNPLFPSDDSPTEIKRLESVDSGKLSRRES
jgi:hypothetical protein